MEQHARQISYSPPVDRSNFESLAYPGKHLSPAEQEQRELARAGKEIARVQRKIERLKRDYPLYVCPSCQRIDGWGDRQEGMLCLHCLTVYPFFMHVAEPLR